MSLDWQVAYIKYPNGSLVPIIISDYLYNLSDGTKVTKRAATKEDCRDAMISETQSECYKVYGNLRYNNGLCLSDACPQNWQDLFSSFFTKLTIPLTDAYSRYNYNGYVLPDCISRNYDLMVDGFWAHVYNTAWLPQYRVTHGSWGHSYITYEFGVYMLAVLPSNCLTPFKKLHVESSLLTPSSTGYSKIKYLNFSFSKYSGDPTYNNDWVGEYSIGSKGIQNSIINSYTDKVEEIVDTVVTGDPYTPNPIPGSAGAPSSESQGGDGTGGGWGDFDYSSDGPQDKNPPSITTYDAGFCTLYAATQAQIKALADYMWADTNDFLNNWNKLWANPMDAILGISLVPLSGLLTGVTTAVKVGNIATSVYMTKLSASIVKVDCGTLYITSQSLSHSFMDFPPYNQVELYLPYIGTVSISASDVIDKYLSISYLCDCLSGSCVAFVLSNGYTVATYSGNIAAAVPVTSGDFANIVFAALDYLKVGGQDVAAGIGGIMASKGGGLKGARGIAETVSAGAGLVEHTFEIGQSILVPQITKGGPAGSTAGYMNHQKPFLIFNAPNVAAPENMNTYIGYAQYETKSLGSCHGFTKVAEIHYRGAGTEAERTEIENLLRMGVDL